jgi:hypothetical protein
MIVTANLGADIERHGDDDTKMDDTVVVSSPISCWVKKDANAQLDGTEVYLLVAPSLRAVTVSQSEDGRGTDYVMTHLNLSRSSFLPQGFRY